MGKRGHPEANEPMIDIFEYKSPQSFYEKKSDGQWTVYSCFRSVLV